MPIVLFFFFFCTLSQQCRFSAFTSFCWLTHVLYHISHHVLQKIWLLPRGHGGIVLAVFFFYTRVPCILLKSLLHPTPLLLQHCCAIKTIPAIKLIVFISQSWHESKDNFMWKRAFYLYILWLLTHHWTQVIFCGSSNWSKLVVWHRKRPPAPVCVKFTWFPRTHLTYIEQLLCRFEKGLLCANESIFYYFNVFFGLLYFKIP